MSIKSSGLWCDLCGNIILSEVYWNIKINGEKGNFHSCDKCKKERSVKPIEDHKNEQ